MKLDTATVLRDLQGNEMMADKDQPATVRLICTNALLGHHADDANISGDEKFKRFQLASRLNEGKAADVSSEEIVLLKRMIGRSYTPAVVGPMFMLLEARA
jgi:hypothetical protein